MSSEREVIYGYLEIEEREAIKRLENIKSRKKTPISSQNKYDHFKKIHQR